MVEWAARKARANFEKHGVAFDEAASAFDDPGGLDGEDLRHSVTETRRLRLAMSEARRLLVVAYTMRGQAVRLISARFASRRDGKRYGEAQD